MNNIIDRFNFSDLLSSAFDAKNTFQGESEWRQVFDKLMMGVFTRDGNEQHVHSDTRPPANSRGIIQNPVKSDDLNNAGIDLHQDKYTVLQGRSVESYTAVNKIPSAELLSKSQSNVEFAINPNEQNMELVNGQDAADVSSNYYWEMLRKKLLNNKMDRLHIVLAKQGIKIYLRNNYGSEESVRNILSKVLTEISHKDYAVIEIKINGKSLKNYRG